MSLDRLPFLNLSISVPMFKCAIAAATLQHREANTSVMRFLVELFQVPKVSENCTVSSWTVCRGDLSVSWSDLGIRSDLSVRSSDFSVGRSDLCVDRNDLSVGRSDLSVYRSDLRISRNDLIVCRNHFFVSRSKFWPLNVNFKWWAA